MTLCQLQYSSKMSHRSDNLSVVLEISLDMKPEKFEEAVLKPILS